VPHVAWHMYHTVCDILQTTGQSAGWRDGYSGSVGHAMTYSSVKPWPLNIVDGAVQGFFVSVERLNLTMLCY